MMVAKKGGSRVSVLFMQSPYVLHTHSLYSVLRPKAMYIVCVCECLLKRIWILKGVHVRLQGTEPYKTLRQAEGWNESGKLIYNWI